MTPLEQATTLLQRASDVCLETVKRGEHAAHNAANLRNQIDAFLSTAQPDSANRVPSFDAEWAKKEAEGFRYGRDALEQVRLGFKMAIEAMPAPAAQPPHAEEAGIDLSAFDGNLWSFMRDVLEQGRSIQMDNAAGKYETYEHLSGRLDEAARERVPLILAELRRVREGRLTKQPT